MVVVSLALSVILLVRKKCSVYGAIALGMAVFIGLVLLDTTVILRYLGLIQHRFGSNLGFALNRLLHGSERARSEVISNLIVFVPFGFFLAEFFASLKRFSIRRRFGFATLAGFGLSLCIECLQLLLRLGFFELTDLVMNTMGAVFGVGVSVIGRSSYETIKEKQDE